MEQERDLSGSLMTMTETFDLCVTMVEWVDVLDSDRGDFSRRDAVDTIFVWDELRMSFLLFLLSLCGICFVVKVWNW